MARAHINPTVLRWAAERSGAESADLAVAFNKTPDQIEAWMAGSAAPTFAQAQKLARRLRVPFGYLFLRTPPIEPLPVPDFRRVHGAGPREPSVDLRDVLADVLRKRDWYRDYRLNAGDGPLRFVGRFSLHSSVSDVARHIAQTLDFESVVRPQRNRDDFLKAFVGQVEELEILVMRNGVVRNSTNRPLDPEEFRGFSIADPLAPVIFINNADSKAAQGFTLAHELAHVWIGEGGISDADPTIEEEASESIEAFCNEVAAELLLPWRRIADSWKNCTVALESWIGAVSTEFNVSTVMAARQLWARGGMSREEFFSFYETEQAKWTANSRQTSGGNFYWNVPIRNSRLLTRLILRSVAASETLVRDASHLLGVKPANLPKLQNSMGGL
ncbi:MAG: XRE family transcriptional regulator [bacterium]|nr:ImmA/IrrE family metallo-endopeptidase [Acidimicrobiia bacterium]MCY4649940.1 XRE family transcriptional regulator [bacterium]